MNLPNKLTTLRVIMIPFFVFFLLWQNGENYTFRMIALALFIIASLTDLLDGKIARKYNLVTNFGKFMDPLADKLLVCSALICLIELNALPAMTQKMLRGKAQRTIKTLCLPGFLPLHWLPPW